MTHWGAWMVISGTITKIIVPRAPMRVLHVKAMKTDAHHALTGIIRQLMKSVKSVKHSTKML
jgi:hypothetical protein